MTQGDGLVLPMLTTVQNGILSSAMLSAVARLKRPDLIDFITERYIAELVFATDAGTRQLAWQRIFPKSLETGRHLYSRPDEGGRRIHLQAGGLDRSTTAAIVRLRAQSTLLTGAAAASLFNLIVLLFVRLRIEEFSSTSNGEAAVAVMLAVPGLLVGYIARPSEHEVLSRFLVGVPMVALASASLSFIAALTLFAGYDIEKLRCILTTVVVIAATSAARKEIDALVELARRDLGIRGPVRIIGSGEGRLSPLSRSDAADSARLLSEAAADASGATNAAKSSQLPLPHVS